jgi:hypothetical protein
MGALLLLNEANRGSFSRIAVKSAEIGILICRRTGDLPSGLGIPMGAKDGGRLRWAGQAEWLIGAATFRRGAGSRGGLRRVKHRIWVWIGI